jgi:hypothetical protein
MSLQKIMNEPHLWDQAGSVPKILRTLISGLVEKDGLTEEGIFRISVDKNEMDMHKAELDKGNFDISYDSPHVPACLLKLWLRELPQPIIPQSMYDDALDCVTGPPGVMTRARILGVWAELDHMRKRVTSHIAAISQELSKKANSATNKMSFHSLAIVFAPSFLRNPILAESLAKVKLEIEFVRILLEILPTTHLQSLVKAKPKGHFGVFHQTQLFDLVVSSF